MTRYPWGDSEHIDIVTDELRRTEGRLSQTLDDVVKQRDAAMVVCEKLMEAKRATDCGDNAKWWATLTEATELAKAALKLVRVGICDKDIHR